MKITSLVTGGAGFIGSHVVNHLIEKGHKVIVLDDLSGGFEENVNPESILVVGSILDVDLVNKIFTEYSITYVYHLAAYAAEGMSHFVRRFNYENNLIGSINLINAAVVHKTKCFVFASSIAVYGTNNLPLHEAQHPKPEDPYGIAKYAVEMDLYNAKKMFGLDYIIFRPHNVYGVRQNIGDKYRNVIGIFMNQILQDKPLTIFGNGEQTRAFSYVDDVAPYIAESVNIPNAYNQTFNIGGDQAVTVKELALKVGEAMKVNVAIEYLEKREEVIHAYADHSNFNRTFTPKAPITLTEGLLKMANWVKAHGSKTTKSFTDIEIKTKLPKSWQEA